MGEVEKIGLILTSFSHVDTTMPTIHEEVGPLIEDIDVLLKEIPLGLLPMRDIQHHIDLIP